MHFIVVGKLCKVMLRICLLSAVITLASCSTSDLSRLWVYDPIDRPYTHFLLAVTLDNQKDTTSLTNKLVEQFDRYKAEINLLSGYTVEPETQADTAILKIEEIQRESITVRYKRGQASPMMTQMRGRRYADKPVVTMRATLVDAETGQYIFKADYIAEGQWYTDSSVVVRSLARKITTQFESEGLLEARQ